VKNLKFELNYYKGKLIKKEFTILKFLKTIYGLNFYLIEQICRKFILKINQKVGTVKKKKFSILLAFIKNTYKIEKDLKKIKEN